MRYFTKDFPKADNNPRLSKAQQKAMHRLFLRRSAAYDRQLRALRHRLSKQAWNFFYFGFGRWGLHDAQLLTCTFGDGLDYKPNGLHPLRVNKEKVKARIQILDRHQNLLCTFTCRGISKAVFDYPTDDPLWNDRGCVDMLLTYEMTAASDRYLRLEFLFASGATIKVEFERLHFKRERIRRRYSETTIYS